MILCRIDTCTTETELYPEQIFIIYSNPYLSHDIVQNRHMHNRNRTIP